MSHSILLDEDSAVKLTELGWTADLQAAWNDVCESGAGLSPARVAAEWRGAFDVWNEEGERRATVAGALHHEGGPRPAVGDWVALDEAGRIRRLLPRRSLLRRKAVGRATVEQSIAANIDTVFVVTAADADFNPRRIERYTTAIWDGGAVPVVLINKADLAADVRGLFGELESSAPGVMMHALSATTGAGLDALNSYLFVGATVALVGSSGVGKSTLVNRLAGTLLETQALGVDGKGRHTTTNRQMHRLPTGGLLIDTPGMREFGLVDDQTGLSSTFSDVVAWAEGCRFADCEHGAEPGCVVQRAITEGRMPRERWLSYQKLERELLRMEEKQDGLARAESNKKRRAFSRMCRARTKAKKAERG